MLFCFNGTWSTEIYTLSLHDALPIFELGRVLGGEVVAVPPEPVRALGGEERLARLLGRHRSSGGAVRSEEHTSELQSRQYLVCRLLLEKKKHRRVGRARRPAQRDAGG